ncbi:MAG: hypothetical protein K6T91_10200 [Firmicutes bacterium]|nr:hypothetical protein [Bacillota bacterium]
MNLSRKWIVVVILAVIAIIAVVGARQVLIARNSGELDQKTQEVLRVAINGWTIKHTARLASNQGKTNDIKQELKKFYDDKSGALAKQQRYIDALIAADKAKSENSLSLSTNTPLQILGFRVTDVKVKDASISRNSADITAEIEYYIQYDTQHANYSALGKNTYKFKLNKEKDGWKIAAEDLVSDGEE